MGWFRCPIPLRYLHFHVNIIMVWSSEPSDFTDALYVPTGTICPHRDYMSPQGHIVGSLHSVMLFQAEYMKGSSQTLFSNNCCDPAGSSSSTI